MALTLKNVVIKDPDSADMVILSNIMDGVDGAASMGWTLEGEEVRIEDNQTYEHSHMGELDIKVLRLNDTDLATLRGLVGKRVEIMGWTIDGFFLMRDNPILNRHEDYNSAILNDRIYVSTKAPKGYSTT
jgi:hypothetical protein